MRDMKPPDDAEPAAAFVSPARAGIVVVVSGAVVVVTPPGGSSGVADGVTGPSEPGSPA
jgi:hypothetical protein